MAVAYESDGGTVFAAVGSNGVITVPLPATRPTGSVLLGVAWCRLISGTTAGTMPSGYSLLHTATSGTASGGRIWIYATQVVGGEVAPTFGCNNAATGTTGDLFGATLYCYSGVDLAGGISAILDGTPQPTDASGTTTCTFAAISNTTTGNMIVRTLARFRDAADTFTPTASPLHDEREDLGSTTRTGGQHFLQDRTTTGTGSQAAVTVAPSNTTAARYLSLSMLLKVAPPSTPWSQPVNDAIAGTDADNASVGKGQADAAAGTDATSRLWAALRTQPDTATGTDAQAKTVAHPLADTATVTDAIDAQLAAGQYEQPVDDTIAGTDATARVWAATRSQPDAIAGTDAQAKTVRHPLADTAAGTDARSSKPTHAIADTAAGTDASTRRPVKAQADTIAGTDARAKASGHPIADAIAGTDARSRVWTAKLTVADGITVADDVDTSAAGANEKDLDDAATVTDAISVSLGLRRTLGDSLTATDAHATQADYTRQPADALAVTDALARAWAIFEAQDDALTVTDAVNARIPPARWSPATDEDWLADTDEDWEAQTDDRWLVSAESRW